MPGAARPKAQRPPREPLAVLWRREVAQRWPDYLILAVVRVVLLLIAMCAVYVLVHPAA